MRKLTTHHDGHGLNDRINLSSDDLDPNSGGAAHRYQAFLDGDVVVSVQFQQGPRNAPTSVPGATEAVLLAVLIDRMECFQAGPYSCRENALVRTKLEEALLWLNHRTNERAKRGVLGTNVK